MSIMGFMKRRASRCKSTLEIVAVIGHSNKTPPIPGKSVLLVFEEER
jgi:hypothetical protein